jgi:hypothetical protein
LTFRCALGASIVSANSVKKALPDGCRPGRPEPESVQYSPRILAFRQFRVMVRASQGRRYMLVDLLLVRPSHTYGEDDQPVA